ncbi:unnamed protein product, partial [marine sediment metagenome]
MKMSMSMRYLTPIATRIFFTALHGRVVSRGAGPRPKMEDVFAGLGIRPKSMGGQQLQSALQQAADKCDSLDPSSIRDSRFLHAVLMDNDTFAKRLSEEEIFMA